VNDWTEPETVAEPPCPTCEPVEGVPDPLRHEGTPCPICGRGLPLPAGTPGGTVLTILLYRRILGQSVMQVWETARSTIEDERLRTNLLQAIDPDTPDAYISVGSIEVPDPVTPAVLELVDKEQAGDRVGIRRLLFALNKRKALLKTILRETYAAGFKRDEARVAARLGFHLDTVKQAVKGKTLVRV
jgi:hypothetical protein